MIFARNYRGIYRGMCEENHQQTGQDSDRVPAKITLTASVQTCTIHLYVLNTGCNNGIL